MSFISQCIFKPSTTTSGTIISGFPLSNITSDRRFKDLIVPLGLYNSIQPIYSNIDSSVINNSTDMLPIDDNIFTKLFNNVSNKETTNKYTRKKDNSNKLHKKIKHYK